MGSPRSLPGSDGSVDMPQAWEKDPSHGEQREVHVLLRQTFNEGRKDFDLM